MLRAYNGFEAGHPWIDLTKNMELTIENAYYEPGASRSGLAGFLGTEVARYAVLSTGFELLSVQSMTNRPKNDVSVQNIISTAIRNFHHYRLYYEIVFARNDHSHGSVLLGANTQAEIDQLSAQLTHPEMVCYQSSTHCTVFPEACSVTIEIKIIVNGKTIPAVWGSTLGSVASAAHHLHMTRLYAGQLREVRLDPTDPKALGLPLLPGDRIIWN